MAIIFPNIPTDIENRILYYIGERPRALVNLSGTSKVSYATLSNSFFEQLLTAQHPLLAKTNAVFLQLKTYYSDLCWKNACCIMHEGYKPFSNEFLARAIPSMTLRLQSQREKMIAEKQEAECELQRICGSYYQDPCSPIHQAWEAKVSAEARYSELDARLVSCVRASDAYMAALSEERQTRIQRRCSELEQQIVKILEPFSHDEGHIERFEKHNRLPPGLLLGQKRDSLAFYLKRMFDENFPSYCSRDISEIQDDFCFYVLDIKLIEKYREACIAILPLKKEGQKLTRSPEASKVEQEFRKEYERKRSSSIRYQELEGRRKHLSVKVRSHPAEIITLNEKLAGAVDVNRLCLITDLYFAKHHEIITNDIDSLCYTLGSVICISDEGNKLIGPFLAASKTGHIVLEILYHQCANGVIEDKWAETHAHKFSNQIIEIASGLRTLSNGIVGVYKENLGLSVKCYLDKNIEEIRKDLPFLKEMEGSLKAKIPADGLPMLPQDINYFAVESKKLDPFFRTLLRLQSRQGQFGNVEVRVKLLPFLKLVIRHIESYEQQGQ